METPKPVALSGMEAILANARKIMAKTDIDKPIVMSETTLKQTTIEEAEEPSIKMSTSQGYTREQVQNSKMAQPIKDMMMKSINERLEDMSDLEDIKMTPNKRQPYLKNPIQLQESIHSNNSDMITMSKTEFKALVKENVLEFLIENYNKTLTEQAIKKTINVLIKEGKLSVKPKVT
jgi:hypothetical protein